MERLSLTTFLTAGQDHEASQYIVLKGLREFQSEFSHNRLYPALAELIELHSTLELVLAEREEYRAKLPRQIKSIDLKNKRIIFEQPAQEGADFEQVMELIQWALPRIRQIIDEGTRIYDFVDENIRVEEVGILPIYKEEGYYFVPEHRASQLHLLRYEISLFTSEDGKYRSLRTRVLDSLRQEHIHRSPEAIKLDLIRQYQDMPNPATFVCETDLEFPFSETILPIAKRKLMARLSHESA
ncbi:MAG TPA: hypothetical protein VNN76_06795 [Bacteroidota bacterium]|nr:hypothetical protein [Bacteroidota bacterium]